MAKDGNNGVWGFLGLLMGLFMIFNGSNLFRSDKAFVLIKGALKEDARFIEKSGRRGYARYEFKLNNHFYKRLTFTNKMLYDMKSGIDYEPLLKKNAKVRVHVLKKDFHKEMLTKIYSLEVEGKSIVELQDRSASDWKGFAIGVFILAGGLLLIFD